MKRKWLWLLAPVALVAFVTLGGEVVMHLWNWLAPPLFGFRLITFWQALGLLILCRVLFGGWGSGKHGGRGRWKRDEAWKAMTPEERERFGKRMRGPCGDFGSRPSAGEEPA